MTTFLTFYFLFTCECGSSFCSPEEDLKFPSAIMAQSHQQDLQRNQSGLQQISARIQARTMLAKKRVESIKKNDVKGFFIRNAFVIMTVAAVIIGKNLS